MSTFITALALTISLLAADSPPSFDVASVKPGRSTTGVDRINNSNGSLIVVNVSLKRLIGLAYGIEDGNDYQFAGPEWLDFTNFDISAKYPPETSHAEFLLMFQHLLAERLGLRIHHETREFTVYALTVAKGGSKLRETQNPGPYRFRLQNGQATGLSISMPMFAARLSRQDVGLDRRVVDLTDLPGLYDIVLNWSPDQSDGPSLFTALQEQLGLKLDLRKNIPLNVLVVDHAEKVPSEN